MLSNARPHPKPHLVARGVLAIALAVAIIGARVYYVSRTREHKRLQIQAAAAVDPADGQGLQSELEFSDVQMSQPPGGGRLDIYGRVLNAGNHRISRAIVQLTFKDAKGRKISTIQRPIQGRTNEAFRTLADDFPIEPDQSRFFQIGVNQVPLAWDHNMPELKVITVSLVE